MNYTPMNQYEFNSLSVSRFSTVRFKLRGLEEHLTLEQGATASAFTYGNGDVLPLKAGFDGKAETASSSMTNCFRDGLLTSRDYMFVVTGIAARVLRPHLLHSNGEKFYSASLDSCIERIRGAFEDNVQADFVSSRSGLRFRMGSLVGLPQFSELLRPSQPDRIAGMAQAFTVNPNVNDFSIDLVTDESVHIDKLLKTPEIVVPVRVWLYGQVQAMPSSHYGIPSLSSNEVESLRRHLMSKPPQPPVCRCGGSTCSYNTRPDGSTVKTCNTCGGMR